MASSSRRNQARPSLADYLFQSAPKYRSLSDGRSTYINVSKASDVLIYAENFLNSEGIRSERMSQRDLALRECNKLVRSGIIELANKTYHPRLDRSPNCLVFVRMPSSRGSSSQRRRHHRAGGRH
eukprot:IDg14969t1